MKHITLIITFFIFTSLAHAEIERRLAIDVGSGGTKFAIADVELTTNQIVEIVYESSIPVPYQASLDKLTNNGNFDEETRATGLEAFKEIKKIANEFEVQNVTVIATSAFRKANNSDAFVLEVEKEVQFKIQIILQKEEGKIAFFSALVTGEYQPDEIIVWDIGTGSQQITVQDEAKELSIYMGENMGSVAFKNYIISVIQDQDNDEVDTPNPLTSEDWEVADRYVRAFGRKAFPIIKDKINNNQGVVIGIGRLFYNSIRPLASEGNAITRRGLRAFIDESLMKSDEELNNPFANVDVSNCMLALAVMKALHIHEIIPIETTSTKGILIYPNFWQ